LVTARKARNGAGWLWTPGPAGAGKGAGTVDRVGAASHFDSAARLPAGWSRMYGVAYGFLDPIYSSGVLLALKMAELAADSIHDAFNNNDFSGARLGQFQGKLDRGIESMRKLVYAFYNEGFSFAQFLQKHPDQRVNIINLLMGDVFKEGVDDIFGPMGEFAFIPPPLYEQFETPPVETDESATGEVLSAQYQYYDDREVQESVD
jgi:hypothetical protein